MLIDASRAMLGKRAAVDAPRALRLAKYLGPGALAPDAFSWGSAAWDWPMFLNDQIGDCVVAMMGHQIQMLTTDAGDPVIVSDADVLSLYSKLSGYVPPPAGRPLSEGTNDNGVVMVDAMDMWSTSGVFGHTLEGYVKMDLKDTAHVRLGVYRFGGAPIGIQLPLSAQRQHIWDVPPGGPNGDGEPGSWGGHCVPVIGYNQERIALSTWGGIQLATWAFWGEYCDEGYLGVTRDMLRKGGTDPRGLRLDELKADLAAYN